MDDHPTAMTAPDTRCTSCGMESNGAEFCTLCRHPRPEVEPHAWVVRVDHPGRYLVTVLDAYHIEVARENGPSRWCPPLAVERVA